MGRRSTPMAMTVAGPRPVASLGATLMHEHILCDLRAPERAAAHPDEPRAITLSNRFEIDYFSNREPANMLLDDPAAAAADLRAFRGAGGGAIVELTVAGLSPKPDALRALSEAAGVPVICGAGAYVEAYAPADWRAASEAALTAKIVEQIAVGASPGGVRAGIIGELGCSWPLTDFERRQLRAAAQAQRETGAAITVHPGRHPDAPAEIADILLAAGAAADRVILGHMDRTIADRPRLVALLRRGLVLEWDFFGVETSQYWMDESYDLPTDYMRLDLIHGLLSEGFGGQIVISHDICTRTRLQSFGGHGYAHIPRHIAPMMRRRGWSEAQIDDVLTGAPARLLAHRAADAGEGGHV